MNTESNILAIVNALPVNSVIIYVWKGQEYRLKNTVRGGWRCAYMSNGTRGANGKWSADMVAKNLQYDSVSDVAFCTDDSDDLYAKFN